MFGSFLPSLWSSTTTVYSGLRSRRCYEITGVAPRPGRYTDERGDPVYARRSRTSLDIAETGEACRHAAIGLCPEIQTDAGNVAMPGWPTDPHVGPLHRDRLTRLPCVLNAIIREKIYIRWCCIDRLSSHRLAGPILIERAR